MNRSLMIESSLCPLVRVSDIEPGSIAIPIDNRSGGLPVLVLGAPGRRAYAMNGADDRTIFDLDHRDKAICLGPPVLRFNPFPRRAPGNPAAAGDLVRADGRFGFQAIGRGRPYAIWDTPVAWLDGTESVHSHSYEHQAYASWQIGIVQRRDFIIIAENAEQSPSEKS